MTLQQARVFCVYLQIDRVRLAAFERFCDLFDRGVDWAGLERATYLIRESPRSEILELHCSWSVVGPSHKNSERIQALVDGWQKEFGMHMVTTLDTTLRPWTVVHAYFAGARQDSRSPLMDEVVSRAFVREPAALAALRATNSKRCLPPIALSPQDGHLLMNLLLIAGAKRGIEIGTLGGYSAAWICRAIGADGTLVSIEKDSKRARTATENLGKLGFGDRAECRAGDAALVLKNLEVQSPWDFVFIDADKSGYGRYVEWAIQNVKPGGLILADNAYLWGGMLSFPHSYAEPGVDAVPRAEAGSRLHGFDAAEYQGMRDAWKLLSESQEFDSWMLPSPEGLLVARKRM